MLRNSHWLYYLAVLSKTVEKRWFAIIAFIAILQNSNQTYTRICLAALASCSDQVSSWKFGGYSAYRAVKLSISFFCHFSFTSCAFMLAVAGLPPLQAKRLDHSKRFCKIFANPIVVYTIFSHCLEIQPWHPIPTLEANCIPKAKPSHQKYCLSVLWRFKLRVIQSTRTNIGIHFYSFIAAPVLLLFSRCILLHICLLCNCVIKLS